MFGLQIETEGFLLSIRKTVKHSLTKFKQS